MSALKISKVTDYYSIIDQVSLPYKPLVCKILKCL